MLISFMLKCLSKQIKFDIVSIIKRVKLVGVIGYDLYAQVSNVMRFPSSTTIYVLLSVYVKGRMYVCLCAFSSFIHKFVCLF